MPAYLIVDTLIEKVSQGHTPSEGKHLKYKQNKRNAPRISRQKTGELETRYTGNIRQPTIHLFNIL